MGDFNNNDIEQRIKELLVLEDSKNKQEEPVIPESIDDLLEERGSRYGSFDEHARLSRELKDTCYSGKKWSQLSYAQKESIDMIMHKVGRILNGDPNYKDSWTDIIGYARLIEETLSSECGSD